MFSSELQMGFKAAEVSIEPQGRNTKPSTLR